MKKKIAFIVNPKSGNASKWDIDDLIEEHLDREIYGDCQIEYTQAAGHGRVLARDFAAAGFDVVVSVGGDGTMNEVASSLIHTNTSLGVISTGSGNGLARHLKIPQNFIKAVKLLNFSETVLIDYGLVNDEKPFFCTCGAGFDAYVSELFAQSTRRGMMGYLEKMVPAYIKYELQNYQLKSDNIDLKGKAFVITFANASQWGNNAYIAPSASVQDGVMDISVIADVPVIAIPTLAFQLFTKTIRKDLLVTTLKSREITLLRDKPGPFHLDGDPYEEGEKIHIRIVPDGLKVQVAKRF